MGGDKESTIKVFRGSPVGILCFKLLNKWNYPLFPRLRWRGSVTDTEVRQDQSSQRRGHLLGSNWSLLQLMASCGCVFTSHLFWALRFPALKTREIHLKPLFPPLSVCLLTSLSISQKQKKLAFSRLQHDDSYLKSLPKSSHHLVGFWMHMRKGTMFHFHYDTHQFCVSFLRSSSSRCSSLSKDIWKPPMT